MMRRSLIPLIAACACAIAMAGALAPRDAAAETRAHAAVATPRPQVIAHRGASGYLPEHTLAAYALAFQMGADVIEPDVVLTADGVPVCAHDVTMGRVTDVARVYPDRARDDGRYYWIDFTLEEVRRLRVTEGAGGPAGPIGGAVPTLGEMIRLVRTLNERLGRSVGIIPEPKRPAFHRQNGRPIEPALLEELAAHGYEGPADPCVIQCFELDSLRRLRDAGCRLRLVWLVGREPADADLVSAAEFCHGLGPSRSLLEDDAGRARPLLARARELGLALYPYTFGDEPAATARFFHQHKVAGLFTDFPDVALRARDRTRGGG